MKILTDDLKKAFRIEREKYDSNIEMSKKLDISDSMVSRILRGKISHLSDFTWDKMKMVIDPLSCPHGFERCPLNGNCELRNLLDTLVKIKDPQIYNEINELIMQKFTGNKS